MPVPVPREEEEGRSRRRRKRERKNEEASLQGTTRFVLGEGEGIPSIFFLLHRQVSRLQPVFTGSVPSARSFSWGGPGAGVKGKGKNQNPLHLMCCDWKGGALVCCHVVVVVIRYSTCTVAKVHNCLVPEENGPLGARVTTYLR